MILLALATLLFAQSLQMDQAEPVSISLKSTISDHKLAFLIDQTVNYSSSQKTASFWERFQYNIFGEKNIISAFDQKVENHVLKQ